MRLKQKRRIKALAGALSLENHQFVAERTDLVRAIDVLRMHEQALERARSLVAEAEQTMREMLIADQEVSLEALNAWRSYVPVMRSRVNEAEKNRTRSETSVQKNNDIVANRHARIRAIERVSVQTKKLYDCEIDKLSSREIEDLWSAREKRRT